MCSELRPLPVFRGFGLVRMFMGAFPPAKNSAPVRLGVDKTQQLDSIQTGENCRCRHGSEEKKKKANFNTPSEIRHSQVYVVKSAILLTDV